MMTIEDWDRLIGKISAAGCEAYLIRLTSRTLEDAQQCAGEIGKELQEASDILVKLREELEYRGKIVWKKGEKKNESE